MDPDPNTPRIRLTRAYVVELSEDRHLIFLARTDGEGWVCAAKGKINMGRQEFARMNMVDMEIMFASCDVE